MFQMFMLARLLSAHQVVLLCDNAIIYLFFRRKVYYQSAESYIVLPQSRHPIWTLIDVDYQDREPPNTITDSRSIWPIQTSPVRWKNWRKQTKAAMLGMPLWTMEELVKGYVPSSCHMSFDRGSSLIDLRLCHSLCIDPGTTPFEVN